MALEGGASARDIRLHARLLCCLCFCVQGADLDGETHGSELN